ncbi:MAG: CHAD domain-containing protein [Pirellulales bacterium]
MARLSKWIDAVQAGGRVSDAARVSLEARLATVAYWLPLAARQIDEDIEKVHQLRVSTRRAIAALRLYRDWLPRDEYDWLSRRLKRVRRAAGAARDLDVLAEWIRDELSGQGGALLAIIADERAAAQPEIMSIADKCEAENRFRRKMYSLLAGVRPRGKREKKQDVSFHNWAETQLAHATEGFFAALPNQSSDLSALHEFRIQGKHLRYTLELLSSAFPAELKEVHYPVVEELQEQLGRINDCVAADARLRRWRKKFDSHAEQETLDRLIAAKHAELDKSLAEYRGWWTVERAESLRQGLTGLVGGAEAARLATTEETTASTANPR